MNIRAIALFNLGRHGLTVFGMAVRICQRHGHGEDAKTVPPDSHFEKGDGPVRNMWRNCIRTRASLAVTVLCAWILVGEPIVGAADGAGPDHSQLAPIADIGYKDACGPIACYYALTALGLQTTLDQTAKSCGWTAGSMTQFEKMAAVLSSYPQVRVHPVRVSPTQLEAFVSQPGCVAILPVRKGSDEINHAVCVTSAKNGNLHCADYPDLERQMSPDALRQVWDGEALLVERRPLAFGKVEWILAAVFVVGLAILAGQMTATRKSHHSPSPTAVP